MLSQYIENIKALIDTVVTEERIRMEEAAGLIAQAIMNEGVIHVFGAGHSHMLGEELFYRAGGLAAISPIFIEEVMLHKGAVNSSTLEQESGWVEEKLVQHPIREGDVIIVASTSGRNPVPIEVADYARGQGAKVIAITSTAYALTQPSRHSSGRHLFEAANVVINNHVQVGDAMVSAQDFHIPFGSGSSIIGCMIVNVIMVEAIDLMLREGYSPPVFKSNNADDGKEHNEALVEKYKARIPLLALN